MKYAYKRILSAAMVFILVLSSLASSAYAASGGQAEEYSFLPEEPNVAFMEGSRLPELEGTEAVYFGVASAQLREGDRYYSVPVYREGDLETEASVSLLSLDVSALYGADYEFCAENVYSAGQEYTLLEKQNGRGVVLSEEELAEQAELLEQLYEEQSGEESAENTLTSAEETDAGVLTEEGTGGNTEEEDVSSGDTGEYGSFTDTIMENMSVNTSEELTDEEISENITSDILDYSAGYVLHFAKGEAEKQVVFHVMEDELEEGEEMFQFMLADAENTTIRSQYVFAAVITDNEELHDAQISFEQESVTEEMGIAKVTVVRTGSEYSMIEFQLHSVGDTAAAGENYVEFNQTMVMQPYQNSTSFEFEVTGQGRMEVFLTAEVACEVVGTDTCEVLIDVQETEEELEQFRSSKSLVDELSGTSAGSEEAEWETVIEQTDDTSKEHTFDIKIGKGSYCVKYTGSGPAVMKGVIHDKVTDEMVGDYYFTSDKFFRYFYHGASPNKSHSENKYVTADNLGDSYAMLYWHSNVTWQSGASAIEIEKDYQPATTWYRYMLPDWAGFSWLNYNQDMWIGARAKGTSITKHILASGISHAGEFSRLLDQDRQINFPYKWENSHFSIDGNGGDSNHGAPYTKLRIYGFALMYKVFDVKAEPTGKLKYKTGGTEIEMVPFNLKVQSGAQYVEVYQNALAFRPASDESTVIRFGVSQVYLNGHTGAFGHVKNWKIEVDPAGTRKQTLTYPSDGNPKKADGSYDPLDFEGYLLMKNAEYKESVPSDSYIDYSIDSEIQKRVQVAKDDIMNVRMDRYMTDWLSYAASLTREPSARAESTWGNTPVNLSFAPVVEHNDVQVYVLGAENGTFADSSLKVTGAAGSPHIFHTGDTLDLTVKADQGYQVIGYACSTDNVQFTTVEEDRDLFLEQGVTRVWVKPVVTDRHNRIEIQYIGDAEEHLKVLDLIDEEELEDTDWAEKNILLIDNEKADVYLKGRPAVGTAYCLDLIVTDPGKNDGWIYRPYVEFSRGSGQAPERLYGCSHPIIASADPDSNIVRVGAERVKADSLKTYTVKGLVNMAPLSVRRVTGQAPKNTPVPDMNVSTADRQGKVRSNSENKEEDEEVAYRLSTTTDLNGCFELKGITGKSGDIISVLATSSTNTGYIQRVTLGDAETVSIPELTVNYPYNAPEVTSVMFLYSNALFNRDEDLTGNVIQIKDCNLDLLITVNEKNRKAKEVKVHIINETDKVQSVTTFNATREKQSGTKTDGRDSDVWKLTISGMSKVLHPGDRIFISIVDDEKLPVTTASGVQSAEIVYPLMDTGLSFARKNQPKKPQFFQNSLPDTERIELPLLGNGGGNVGATSGLINWTVTDTQDGGYYMTLNIGIAANSYTAGIAVARASQYHSQANAVFEEYKKEYKEKAVRIADQINYAHALNMAENDPELLKYKSQLEKLNNKFMTLADVKDRDNIGSKIMKDAGSEPKQGTTEVMWNADVSVSMNLYWVQGTDGAFHYKFADVVFAFSVYVERTKFKMLFMKIPGYVNYGFSVQLNYAGTFTSDDKVDLKDATFLDAQGNVRDMIMKKNQHRTGMFMTATTGFLGVGVGMKGVLSPRGVISATLQTGNPTPKMKEPELPKDPTPAQKKAYDEELARVRAYNQNGRLWEFKGGIEIDLLITKFSLTLIGGYVGRDAWKDKKGFEFFGVKQSAAASESALSQIEAVDAQREVTVLSVDEENQEVYALKEKLSGTSVMDDFGEGLKEEAMTEDGSCALPRILLENAADDPSIQTVQTDEKGSLFMVFAGSRGEGNGSLENGNADAVYYAVYTTDGTQGSWSKPALLDPDGTFDAKPALTVSENSEDEREGKIVTVTWSSAEKEFEKKHSLLDKVSMLRIKAASFLVNGSNVTVLCEPTAISGKKASASIKQKEEKGGSKASRYMDVAGQSWYSGGKLYSSFIRFDLKDAESIEDIMAVYEIGPKVYLAEKEMSTEVPVLNSLYDISLTNEETMLYNSTAQLVEIDGSMTGGEKNSDKKLVAFTYTQDSDGVALTEEDLDLKLCLVELYDDGREPLVYPSMDISWQLGSSGDAPGLVRTDMGAWVDQSKDPDGDGIEGMALTNAEITQAGEAYYLTYVKNGYLFETINIGKTLQAMFEEDYLAELYREKAVSVYGGKAATKAGESSSEEPWYKVTMDEVNQAWLDAGMDGTRWHSAEETGTKEQALDGDRLIFEGSELDAVGNGSFFTLESAFGSSGNETPGISNYQTVSDGDALYIIYAKKPDDREEPTQELFCVRLNLGGDGTSSENPDKVLAYTDPVQLTDAGHVITNFKASMENGKITVISDYYDQYIPEEGGIKYGANSIAVTQYVPKSNLQIDPDAAGFFIESNVDEKGTDYVRVYYDIKNFGLLPQEGYRTWAEHDGEVIFETEIENTPDGEVRFLREGESDGYSFWYKADDVTADDTVTVWLQVGDKEPRSCGIDIHPEKKLKITDARAVYGENGYEARITVANSGSIDTEATTLSLKYADQYENGELIEAGTVQAENIEVPAMEAGEEVEISVPLKAEKEDFSALGTVDYEAVLGVPGEEEQTFLFTYVSGGPDSLLVEDGKESIKLTRGSSRQLTAELVPAATAAPKMYYCSSDPEVVTIDGNGRMICLKNGVAAVYAYATEYGYSGNVTVIVTDQGDDDEPEPVSIQLPSYVDTDGTWKQDADGKWTYTTKAGVQAKDRWMAIARSTFGGGEGFEWFRFDKNGLMVTGWFRDSDDRMYYLQTVSDGNKGRMLTGWQQIGRKWYYFETVSNGCKGELYVNRTTRDGYYVGSDGVWDGKPKK